MKNCVETLHEKIDRKIVREFRMKLSTLCNQQVVHIVATKAEFVLRRFCLFVT
jgi:hypothetical protein